MPTSTNIPSIITLSPALFQSMGDLLLARELQPTIVNSKPLTVSRGKTALSLSKPLAESLQKLSERELSHLMSFVPRVLCACFYLARRDFLNAGLLDGRFFFARANSKKNPSHPIRIAKALGMDPNCKIALRNIKRAIAVLNGATLSYTYKRKGKAKQKLYEGLINLSNESTPVKGSQLEAATRGGKYFLASINPDLFNLALPSGNTSRFIPIPDKCLVLDNKAFNTSLAILAQLTLRKVGEQELELSESRMMTDSALYEATQASDSRAKNRLEQAINQLVELGLIAARKLGDAGKWLISKIPTALKQGVSNESESEQGKFEHGKGANIGSLNKPPDKPSSQGSDFKRACQTLAKAFTALSKNSQKELLEGCFEPFPLGRVQNPHERSSQTPPPGQRIAIQIQLI